MLKLVIDTFKGYFDNLRSDAFFQHLDENTLLAFSAQRIKCWTDRHFSLVDSKCFSKEQVQSLGPRIKLWNRYQLNPQLKNLSKNQIIFFQNDPTLVTSFKPSKVFKLVLAGKVFQPHFLSFAEKNFLTDTKNRIELFKKLPPISILQSFHVTTQEFISLIKNDFSLIYYLKPHHITDELGNFIADRIQYENNFERILLIRDGEARELLYEAGNMRIRSDIYQKHLEADIRRQRTDFINRYPHSILKAHLPGLLEWLLFYNPNHQIYTEFTNDVFEHIWINGSSKVRHALKPKITERLFNYLLKDHSSTLFETFDTRTFLSHLKKSPYSLETLIDQNKLKKDDLINRLNDELTAIESGKVSNYFDAKAAFLENLNCCTFKDDKIEALKNRWNDLNENDQQIIFSLFYNYIDSERVSSNLLKNTQQVLHTAEKKGIVTIEDLKFNRLYAAKTNGEPDLDAILANLGNLT